MNIFKALSLLITTALLFACGSSDSDDTQTQVGTATFSPQFIPSVGVLPFPNDVFFAGSTDGTLNLPAAAKPFGVEALNALDGFSINAPISIQFDRPVDGSTLLGNSTAHLFEVVIDTPTKAVVGFVSALQAGTDYSVGVSTATDGSRTIQITPLKPLNPKSGYLVALTSGIASTDGLLAVPSIAYAEIKASIAAGTTLADTTLEQIKPLIGTHLAVLTALGVPSGEVLITSSFTTQSSTDVLEAAAAAATAQASSMSQVFAAPGLPFSTNLVNAALPGYANIYAGTVDTPYFLSKASPAGATAIPWQGIGGSNLTQFNPIPVPTETLTIPALVTVPNANSPWYQGFVAQFGVTPEQAGYQWPFAIFQHGIGGDRTNALFIADAYATAGYAVISIDQPLHGLTNPLNPLYQAGNERTFDLDLDGDGTIDPSGAYTVNLENLLVGRDNNRQASLDLQYLTKTAVNIDLNGDGSADLDTSQMHFIGQSLGSIVGTPFLGVNTDIASATLSVPGGGIAQLLRESESFGPRIAEGLAPLGLSEGTSLYDDFFQIAQTVIDSADPLSFAASAAANHPILLQKVIGDTVVPNNSTDRLIDAMGLPAINTLGANPGPLGAVTFTQGGHGSLLVPTPSLAATLEMQTQAIVFAAGNPLVGIPNNGQVILVQDASVVEITP